MGSYNKFLDAVDHIIENCKQNHIIHLSVDEVSEKENTIRIEGEDLINFGSCSYLGLEFDSRLIEGGIKAIAKYGSQFSSSRAYLSVGSYQELEKLFSKIFEAHCIICPTTTLGHISAIPVLVNDEDAVIVDHQVHNSVQTAIALLKPRKIHVELVRHNNIEQIEEKIIKLKTTHKRIWYMADGIYSMYGDLCPAEDLEKLLTKYKELHLYIDDAHGMSCFGKNGRGYILDKINHNDRIVVATSLAKAFASGGGVLIFPNEELARKVRNCGGPLIFSGPMQPAALGVAIESAKIHLSDEITTYQEQLRANITYTRKLLLRLRLPCISFSNSPIFFIGVSLPKIGYDVIAQLKEKGYYLNIGIYPAVPMKNTGIRFTITRLHTRENIRGMLTHMKFILDNVIEKHAFSYDKIYRAFKIKPRYKPNWVKTLHHHKSLIVDRYKSIREVDRHLWDPLFKNMGLVNYDTILLLEQSFSDNVAKEHNWEFEYIIIRDQNGTPVLATYLTISLNKDDLISDRETSEELEKIRKHNPYFLSSEVLSVGAVAADGQQLYINRANKEWSTALKILLEILNKIQADRDINQVIIRDFIDPDIDLEKIFVDNGFIKFQFMNTNYLDNFEWNDLNSFKKTLSPKTRNRFRRDIQRHIPKLRFNIIDKVSPKQIDTWYKLYLNVKNNNLSFNTFTLPYKLFKGLATHKDWVIFELYPAKSHQIEGHEDELAACLFVHINGTTANTALIGINYVYQKEYRVYHQMLYRTALWCKENGIKLINYGYTADREKKKVGAKNSVVYAFIQIQDDYNLKRIAEKDSQIIVKNVKLTPSKNKS